MVNCFPDRRFDRLGCWCLSAEANSSRPVGNPLRRRLTTTHGDTPDKGQVPTTHCGSRSLSSLPGGFKAVKSRAKNKNFDASSQHPPLPTTSVHQRYDEL